MSRLALLRTTVGSASDAEALADSLIAARLACCVHHHAVTSHYQWQGNHETATEWLVEARTTLDVADDCLEAMRSGHPYDVPMVERLEDVRTDAVYVAWAEQVTGAR